MPLVVLYFAGARDAAGTSRETLAEAPATLAALRAELAARHPALAPVLARCRLAVDHEFASDETPLRDGAEVAVVPPVSGAVRAESKGKRVLRLEYEAYRPMAERKLAEIGAEAARAHGAEVAIVHRVGVLAPGDAAVVIACAAPHRTPAFRACEACIERLKRDVPIWKREVYEDGSEWVGLGP